jgi:Tol biopolymer transport system component
MAFIQDNPEVLRVGSANANSLRTVLTTAISNVAFNNTSIGPNGDKIVFEGFDNSPDGALSSGVYIVNSNGSGLTRLVNGSRPSYNGTKIAYAVSTIRGGPEAGLYLINPDGTGSTLVLSTADAGLEIGNTAISPNGNKIVFEGFPTADGIASGIFIVDADGSNLTFLADGHAPSFNGTKIAFVFDGKGSTLATMNPDGSGLTDVVSTTGNNIYVANTAIAADGTFIVMDGYPAARGGTPPGIYAVSANGTHFRRVADGRGPSLR